MTVRHITSEAFEREVLHSERPTLIDFYADMPRGFSPYVQPSLPGGILSSFIDNTISRDVYGDECSA